MREKVISDKNLMVFKEDFANPFSDNFDIKKLATKVSSDTTDKEKDIIDFFVICNQFHLDISTSIFGAFQKLNLSEIELIDFVHKGANKNFMFVTPLIFKQMVGGAGGVAINSEAVEFSKYKMDNGNQIPVQQFVELGGDIVGLLLSKIRKWGEKYKSEKDGTLSENEIEGVFSYLWYCSNVILNIRSSFEILIYENGDLTANDDFTDFKISTDSRRIHVLGKAADMRTHNNLMEYAYPLSEAYSITKRKWIGVESCNILEGQLNLKASLNANHEKQASADSSVMVKYFHFQKERLEYYEGLTLFDINKVLILISDMANYFHKEAILNKDKKLTFSKTPSKVNRKYLISFLSKSTKLEEIVIEKILKALSTDSEEPYLWRKPFYLIGEELYFTLATLNAPNLTLFYEQLVADAGYDKKKSETLLIKAVESELYSEKIDYQFEKQDFSDLLEADTESFSNNILIEINKYYILFQAACYNHPIEPNEVNTQLGYLAEVANSLNIKVSRLETKGLGKPILPIIVSNYNNFSTLNLNTVCILDLQLLKNYLLTGSFRKGQVIIGKKRKIQKEFAKLTYYKNEEEFNQNFLNFIFTAPPVSSICNKIIWKEIQITPEELNYEIKIDSIDLIEENIGIENELRLLENSLNNKYYYDHKERKRELYDESIAFSLANFIHKIAFGDYEMSLHKIDLFHVLEKSKFEGYSHILAYQNKAFSEISYRKIKKDKIFKGVKIEGEEIFEILAKIVKPDQPNEIRLYDYQIENGLLTKSEEKKLITMAISICSTIGGEKYNDGDFEAYFLQLAILKAFKVKYSLDYEFYTACDNLLDSLNFNHKSQRARNFCEEILMIAIKERKHHYGWGLFFKCYTYQNNNFEAAIYGSLYFTSLSKFVDFKYSILISSLFNALKFYRNFKMYSMMEHLNSIVNNFKLKKYDEQKFKLSYYLGAILIAKKNPLIVDESILFFKENFKEIVSFGEKGTFPWLNFLYNLKRFKVLGFKEFDKPIENLINKLESEMDIKSIQELTKKHFGEKGKNKENLIEILTSAFETNSSSDYKFELRHLELPSRILLSESLESGDIEGILLTGLVLNDSSLNYDEKFHPFNTLVKASLEADFEIKTKLNNYLAYVEKGINLSENQIFIWIFNLGDKVYTLSKVKGEGFVLKEVEHWDNKKMDFWVNEKDSFYFDSKNYFDISEQESAYKKLLQNLNFSNLNLKLREEVFMVASIDLTEFAPNLIINENDFISAQMPLTSVISLEWFIQNSTFYYLKENFTSNAWIPAEDGDSTINFGLSKLKPVLEKNNTSIMTSRNLERLIETDLNIFMAHGELGLKTFKGVYTNVDSESGAILNPEQLFGKGEIAILFICNSGVLNEDIFAKGVTSICYDIMRLGYKAVIAPFWKLDISIPSFWYEKFITEFKNGKKLSLAVHMANLELANYKEEISTGFLAPEGKLAMHLYGNPNIVVQKS